MFDSLLLVAQARIGADAQAQVPLAAVNPPAV
jgi:hypothetical protein